jgi:TonB family protein
MLRSSLTMLLLAASSFATPSIAQTKTDPPKPARAGVQGVGVPVCVYCPIPQYTDQARKAKFQGVVILEVTITTGGKAINISVVKGPGMGLEEKAVEAVKGWKFKPAVGPSGDPVDTLVPIEVTFRNFK